MTRTLEIAYEHTPPPGHIGSDLRMVVRQHLRSLLSHLIDAPWYETRQGPKREKCALYFDSFGISVDPSTRRVVPVGRSSTGRLERSTLEVDLLCPVDAPLRLHQLAVRKGWVVDGPQRHLFCRPRDAFALDQWMVRKAWRALRMDECFLQRIEVEWPRELKLDLELDPELIQIALRSRTAPSRRHLSTREFTAVWRNEAAFRQVARENPGLLPLLMTLADAHTGKTLPSGRDPVAMLKDELVQHGATQAAWRYVVRHGSRVFRAAWEASDFLGGYPRLEQAAAWLAVLQRAGLPPPPPRSVADQVALAEDEVVAAYLGTEGCLPDDVLALALREADRRRRRPDLASLRAEIAEACRAPLGALEPLDDNQKRAGWATFVRRMRRDVRRHQDEEGRLARNWRTTFTELEFGGLRAVPLASGDALHLEADHMRNCLGSFAERCRIGLMQVISFREAATGKRVGDAAYERQPLSRGVTWRLAEVREFANATAGEQVRRLAMACEDVLNVVDLAGPRKAVGRRLRCARRAAPST